MKSILFSILKWTGITLGGTILVAAIGVTLFLYISPQFGKKANKKQKEELEKKPHFEDGKFLNKEKIAVEMSFSNFRKMLGEFFNPHPNVVPKQDVKVKKIDTKSLINKVDTTVRITWLGHSSFFIEMDGKNILLDPVFSDFVAPSSLVSRKRFNKEKPITIEQLPEIDVVVISHDHYDHLDYPTILKLKDKAKQFFVPLGVGNHLKSWNVKNEKIKEFDWWQELKYKEITFAFAPSRHMSGRGISDQSSTLWGSWVLKGKEKNVYFSGDGGYGKHFEEIGKRYGSFDIALMECGQYNKLWADVHMIPEQSIQAAIDINAKMILPMHWGSFSLAPHSWTEPIERAIEEANKRKLPIVTPQIGETITLKDSILPNKKWWKLMKKAI